jgi:hypothetical protein
MSADYGGPNGSQNAPDLRDHPAYRRQEWDTDGLRRDFEVLGFAMGLVVIRRSDGQKGSLEFGGRPRVYFNFVPHQED